MSNIVLDMLRSGKNILFFDATSIVEKSFKQKAIGKTGREPYSVRPAVTYELHILSLISPDGQISMQVFRNTLKSVDVTEFLEKTLFHLESITPLHLQGWTV